MDSTVRQMAESEVAENYLALAREFQDQHLYGKAEKTIKMALEKFPGQPFLLSRLSTLYLQLDMPAKALEALDQIIRRHPELSFPYFMRGKIHEEQGKNGLALEDYAQSLSGSTKDNQILKKYIPLLILVGQADEAYSLVKKYQKIFKSPYMFGQYEAEALLHLEKPAAAFNKMRELIMHNPSDTALVRRYLQFSIKSSRHNPRNLYGMLQTSMPGLSLLSSDDLADIEVEYLLNQDLHKDALTQVHKILANVPDNFYWRKKSALIRHSIGELENCIEDLRLLFLQNPQDLDVREALENFFVTRDRTDAWHQLVQEALKRHSDQLDLFDYMRGFSRNADWLAICELTFEEFMKQVEDLNLVRSNLNDDTFEKIPAYALEAFISRIAVQNRIPEVAEVWQMVCKNLKARDKIAPFQTEDLEASYPVWIFALHLYFLLKSKAGFPISFSPSMLQTDSIAGTIFISGVAVEIDLQRHLKPDNHRLKPLVKSSKGLRWRLDPSQPKLDNMLHEINFYAEEQFKPLLKKLYSFLDV